MLNLLTPARDVYEQLRLANEQIRALQQRLADLSQGGIHADGHRLTTPLEFARVHCVSVSTVNRALNSGDLLGVRQPNGRWLVYADQPYHRKRNRG